jgi:hypothetical protein
MSDPAPAYDLSHGGHPRDSIEFGVIGYDVVATSWTPGAAASPVTVTVTAYVDGPTNYLRALGLAKAHRTGPGHFGYTTPRYACGCRAVANTLDHDPTSAYPAPIFVDLDPDAAELAASMARHPSGRDVTRDAVNVLAAAGLLAD